MRKWQWLFVNVCEYKYQICTATDILYPREIGKYVSVCAADMSKNCDTLVEQWAGIAQSAQRLATAWKVRGSNTDEGETFRTPSGPAVRPTQLLYNGYRVFTGGKVRPGRGVYHPPHLAPRLKKE